MSEVDRLSNSGLYPALPIADRESRRNPRDAHVPEKPSAKPPDDADPNQPRPPKSLIDEYA
jgi:hypothetical protein